MQNNKYVSGITYNPYEFGACHALNDAISEVKKQPKVLAWTPCSLDLPKGYDDAEIELLVTVREEYIEYCFEDTTGFALYYPKDKSFHSVYGNRVDITDIVIAWMYLPERYEE